MQGTNSVQSWRAKQVGSKGSRWVELFAAGRFPLWMGMAALPYFDFGVPVGPKPIDLWNQGTMKMGILTHLCKRKYIKKYQGSVRETQCNSSPC